MAIYPFPDWMDNAFGLYQLSIVTDTDTNTQYFWGFVACPNNLYSQFETHLQNVKAAFRRIDNPIYEFINAGGSPNHSPQYFEGHHTFVSIVPPVSLWDHG